MDIDPTRWPLTDEWIELLAGELEADPDFPLTAGTPAAAKARELLLRAMNRVADWRTELKLLRILNKIALKAIAKDAGFDNYTALRQKLIDAHSLAVLAYYDDEGNYIGD